MKIKMGQEKMMAGPEGGELSSTDPCGVCNKSES